MKTTKKIALSIEQMRHLQKLGIDGYDASMMYNLNPEDSDEPELCFSNCMIDTEYYMPAYTLQDLLEKLPSSIDIHTKCRKYVMSTITMCLKIDGYDDLCSAYMMDEHRIKYVSSINGKGSEGEFRGKDLLEIAYQELCWVKENGYL